MSLIGVMAIGYLAATTYLVLRDDLIGASMARQARMQHAYEDRIAALRSQVDRVTSRQLLDQQLMEEKVAELIARQDALSNRHVKLGPLLDRAGVKSDAIPVPASKPEGTGVAPRAGAAPKMRASCSMASRSDILADPKTARINPAAFASTASVAAARKPSVSVRTGSFRPSPCRSNQSSASRSRRCRAWRSTPMKPLQRSARSSNLPDFRSRPR
jgi:hypothetical protein